MSPMLASAGVGAAAGALIAFSFAMSPPLSLLPSRPNDANGNLSLHRNAESANALADDFDLRDLPPMPTSKVEESSALQDPTGSAMPSMTAVQLPPTQQDELEFVLKSPQNSLVALVGPKPPERKSGVCARDGLHRAEYMRNGHRYWRCLHRQHVFSDRRTVSESKSVRVGNQAPSGNRPQPFFQGLTGFFFQSTE